MKQFEFSLETVLDYKQQVLDSLQVEHGAILARVHQQEEVLAKAKGRYTATNEEFREKKKTGLTIAGMRSFEVGLSVLEQEIKREVEKLEALYLEESELHDRLVASKIDTSSLEILKEKKHAGYQREVQKQEELWIDEILSFTRAAASKAVP